MEKSTFFKIICRVKLGYSNNGSLTQWSRERKDSIDIPQDNRYLMKHLDPEESHFASEQKDLLVA